MRNCEMRNAECENAKMRNAKMRDADFGMRSGWRQAAKICGGDLQAEICERRFASGNFAGGDLRRFGACASGRGGFLRNPRFSRRASSVGRAMLS
ncbi:MAG: hypothetical protein LBM04_05560 [Opitutaceae bacterium]|nr:hypothetical protein [Opitutaceae bacterium]